MRDVQLFVSEDESALNLFQVIWVRFADCMKSKGAIPSYLGVCPEYQRQTNVSGGAPLA